MSQKIKSLAPLGAADECVIVPLRGTIWCGGAVSPGFVPLRGTHLGFYSLAALRATCAFGAGLEGVIGNISPGERPLSIPQRDSCPTEGYHAIVKTSPAATPSESAKDVRKGVAAGDGLMRCLPSPSEIGLLACARTTNFTGGYSTGALRARGRIPTAKPCGR